MEHEEEFTSRVIRRLSHENLEGKKVMLETSSYPVGGIAKTISPSFANFYDGIAAYVLERNGMLVFGEDPALHKRAIEKMNELGRLMADLRGDYCQRWEEYRKEQWRYSSFKQEQIEAELGAEREKLEKKEKPLWEKVL
ncbi:MAG: hypothetical protein KJ955_05895 [Nanoarchaeota archaeon]|nr:hypothetical protein [Nanoarchaeota archaeon]